jgi:hypothetical protein
MNTHITPFLSKDSRIEIQEWNARKNEHNAFHRLIDQVGNVECQNCGDFMFLLVSFVRAGPFRSVPNHRVGETLTWFDGDQSHGKGWYIVVKTRSFDCDNCR